MLRFTIDGEKHEFDQHRIMNVEAIAVKKYTGLSFMAWLDAISESDGEAVTALVWLVKKRIDPELKYTEVEFNVMEFLESLEMDAETDDESDPTDSTETPEPGSPSSPTISESESGSSPA